MVLIIVDWVVWVVVGDVVVFVIIVYGVVWIVVGEIIVVVVIIFVVISVGIVIVVGDVCVAVFGLVGIGVVVIVCLISVILCNGIVGYKFDCFCGCNVISDICYERLMVEFVFFGYVLFLIKWLSLVGLGFFVRLKEMGWLC